MKEETNMFQRRLLSFIAYLGNIETMKLLIFDKYNSVDAYLKLRDSDVEYHFSYDYFNNSNGFSISCFDKYDVFHTIKGIADGSIVLSDIDESFTILNRTIERIK